MQKENVGLQAFAAEVFKRDPHLYSEAMFAAREFVITRKRHWLDRSRSGEVEALDMANAVVKALDFLNKDEIQDVPDISRILGFNIQKY